MVKFTSGAFLLTNNAKREEASDDNDYPEQRMRSICDTHLEPWFCKPWYMVDEVKTLRGSRIDIICDADGWLKQWDEENK